MEIKEVWYIWNADKRKYFLQYRIDEGWTSELSNAKEFSSEEELLGCIQKEYLSHFFEDEILEFKKYRKLVDNGNISN